MYTTSDTSFPSKLKALRITHGKSQEALAKELGISRSCLANYETGNRQPDQETLIRIADIFNVLTDYLVDRTDFRNFDLTRSEMDELIQIKNKLNIYNDFLDLSSMDIEGRIAVIQFYNHINRIVKNEEQ
ncbi:MAG: helix-turn-helix transcriptional regulator [Ruminococcaceae bacterium]|nr:helix-turn-helix transcriptional regulator [Oscillospiraceae bacterium]